MRTAISAILILLGASTSAYPQDARIQDARIDVFQRICIEAREGFSASEATALQRGWTAASENSRRELQRVFEFARTADTAETPISRLQAYTHPEFEHVALVLSEMTVQERRVNGCYLYDFAATEPLAPEVFVRIVGSQPTEAHFQPGQIVMQKWVAPAAFAGVATLRAGFMPVGSEAGEQVGIVGLALALTSFSQARTQ